MAEAENNNTLLSRLSSYSAVGYAVDKAKGYYNYAKDNNTYVKASLETAEKYSHKLYEYNHPTIDALLVKTDQYGCKQLDKIEYRGKQLQGIYESVKPKTIESLDKAANKIHGTPVEYVLLKTISSVDGVVDVLFPPKNDEPAEVSHVPEDPNVLSQTTPIVNKLVERVSTDSVKQLPFHVYSLTKDYFYVAAIPQLVDLLSLASRKVKKVTPKDQNEERKGEEIELEEVNRNGEHEEEIEQDEEIEHEETEEDEREQGER